MDKQREMFEAWQIASGNFEKTDLKRDKEDCEKYFYAPVQLDWETWQAAIAAQSEVPLGWKLVPIVPTEKMVNEGSCAQSLPGPHYIDTTAARKCWEYMISMSPEPTK